MPDARDKVLSRFRWVDGHADVWRIFHDADVFSVVVEQLASAVTAVGATKVAGIESRGFILGGAVALRAGVGFVPIRKSAGLFPGPKATTRAAADYRGLAHELRVQRPSLTATDRVVLVDDWAEVGSQAGAARRLIEECGAAWAGLSVVVDQLSDERRAALSPVARIVTADELGPSSQAVSGTPYDGRGEPPPRAKMPR